MFPAEDLWLCIAIPALIVASLILIKLAQLRINKQAGSEVKIHEIQIRETSAPKLVVQKGLSAPVGNYPQGEPKPNMQDKPENCQKYLGYLYMRQASEKTHIPTECYNCRKLLQCMYSPNVIEKVYGQ
jgi:hypothetical protein